MCSPPPGCRLRGYRRGERVKGLRRGTGRGSRIPPSQDVSSFAPIVLVGTEGEPLVSCNKKGGGGIDSDVLLQKESVERISFGRWKEEKEKLSFVCVCVPIRGPPGSLLAYREEKKKKRV